MPGHLQKSLPSERQATYPKTAVDDQPRMADYDARLEQQMPAQGLQIVFCQKLPAWQSNQQYHPAHLPDRTTALRYER